MKYRCNIPFPKISVVGVLVFFLLPVYTVWGKDPVYKVVVIHSYDEEYVAYPDFNALLSERFRAENVAVDVRYFYLDCEQYQEEPEKQRMYAFLDTIADWHPDLILVNEDQATYSTLACGHPLPHQIPVVFSGVNFPNWSVLKQYDNVTGFWDEPDYLETVNMIETLLGKIRIRFFYDNTYLGRQVTRELSEQLKARDIHLARRLNKYLAGRDTVSEHLLYDVKRVPGQEVEIPETTQFFFTNLRDNRGNDVLWAISGVVKYCVFVQTKYDFTAIRIGKMATIPTFTVINESFSYNQGVLGGYITTLDIQVNEAADYVIRLLRGASISSLPLRKSEKKHVVDWHEIERWHIPVEKIPANYEIVNIPYYISHRGLIILLAALFSLFILSLIFYLSYLYFREARQKREARDNLRKEKEFLSLALEGSDIFAWKYDQQRDCFVFDKEFFENLGFPPRVYTLQQLSDFTHPEDYQKCEEQFRQVADGACQKTIVACRCDFNGKGYVWYEFRYMRLSGMSSAAYSVIGLILNIQGYKDREQSLTEARDLAAKAELKQSFLANMSHEIRTPLNAIIGFTNLLIEEETQTPEERRDFINIINKNCELLLKLINDILEISRIESGSMSFQFEPCSLNEFLEEIYATFQLMMPEQVSFQKKWGEASLTILTDKYRVNQIITNFINNAVKFTKVGYIRIGYEWDAAREKVLIFVEDTGKGIPANEQKMVFERFYKRDEFVQGTGLGLSICKGIAEKLGGEIMLKSEEGKGSRFTLVLPGPDRTQHSVSPEKERISVSGKKEKITEKETVRPTILVAEDTESNYKLIKTLLQRRYELIWVTNGKDAVQAVNEKKIDLVLMDVKMPEMNGLEALKEIRKKHNTLPVIMQTAYAFETDKQEAVDAGCSGFITKPIIPARLLAVIGDFFTGGPDWKPKETA